MNVLLVLLFDRLFVLLKFLEGHEFTSAAFATCAAAVLAFAGGIGGVAGLGATFVIGALRILETTSPPMSATTVPTKGSTSATGVLVRVLVGIGMFATLFSILAWFAISRVLLGLGLRLTGLEMLLGKEELGFTILVVSVEIIHAGDIQIHEFVMKYAVGGIPDDLDSA